MKAIEDSSDAGHKHVTVNATGWGSIPTRGNEIHNG